MRKVGSRASLGRYDVKITKRVPLRALEEEFDFSDQVEMIRHELSKKSLHENGGEKRGEESILSQKRYKGFLVLIVVCLVAKLMLESVIVFLGVTHSYQYYGVFKIVVLIDLVLAV